ncbi:unnamed protein product [Rotaria sordida]|uniref:RING-type domain-containing protein n=1 Tax=Rotaria sordida TaxID=392033 RepID=A0A818YLD9_9BILA|nr:unnamed protein product [Rotaria sordida]CAF3752561.1 unnamed protein product [Rotaria sordida]
MSVSHENLSIMPQPTAATPPSEEKTLICSICEATIADTDERLICPNEKCEKWTCFNCANMMIEIMFSQPTLNYPLKCGVCGQEFDRIKIEEMIIKSEHYEQYIACIFPLYWSDECLEEYEQLAQCPFCPYLEIHTTDACSIQFLTCQNPACGKRSCLICLHAIDDDLDQSNHQSICIQLQKYKRMVEQAIELGSVRRCPHCQLTGIKDDNCTHMVCERCELSWCYVCGMKEEECDVDSYADHTLSDHNQGWESNEKRCPMYLYNIYNIDNRWPTSDEGCREYLHRYRTLCELSNVLKIIGEDKFYELNDTFRIIDAAGYTIDEIKNHETCVLIKYPTNND